MNIQADRRAFMVGALASVGYSVLPRTVRAAMAPLPLTHRSLLDLVADSMIPATDTPGARAAGVPAFLEELLVHWANPSTRGDITAVLDAIDAYAVEHIGASLQTLDPGRRTEMLAQFDRLHVVDLHGPYRRLKGLILFGYYSSEPGAMQELRYELVPGAWQGCIPLATVGRSWAV